MRTIYYLKNYLDCLSRSENKSVELSPPLWSFLLANCMQKKKSRSKDTLVIQCCYDTLNSPYFTTIYKSELFKSGSTFKEAWDKAANSLEAINARK
ncbi:hypothetical protein BpHYR1_051667 [Brachionus plicatilis]|uniref:Uncharacterized protein n=1 Tax=Brachionus plicatilis TaxID=10195 RepID=A0A3M7PVT6_BRAPC|nr:hypothetical protein BpHYR1_051667 [Brachionus plicatilis]